MQSGPELLIVPVNAVPVKLLPSPDIDVTSTLPNELLKPQITDI